MQKIEAINQHLLSARNKVSERYKSQSPELFHDNQLIQQNDDLLATRLSRGVDDEINPYK